MIYQTNISTMKDLNMITLNGQGGAVLVTSLLILVVLTLLAISTMSTSNFELIMATNIQSQSASLANAEVAVGEGEVQIKTSYAPGPISKAEYGNIDPSSSASHALGIYQWDSDTKESVGFEDPTTFNWDGANGFITGPSGNQYVIEYLGKRDADPTLGTGDENPRFLYRVTGRGTSGRGGERLVQTIYLTQ